jgi:hypothetical protein
VFAVGEEAGGLGLVELDGDAVDDVAAEHGHLIQAAPLPLAGEEGHAVALGVEVDGAAGHELVVDRDVLELAGVPLGEVLDHAAVLGRQQDEVGLSLRAVAGEGGHDFARGAWREGEDLGERRLLLVGREVLAVVGRPLLVAEGLEALLQPLLELLVELLRLHAERLHVDVLDPAAHDVLAEGVEELPDPFFAEAGLDELEGGVAEVVDDARVGVAAVFVEAAQLGNLLRDRGVADGHEVERVPGATLVVGQPLVEPEGDRALHQAARDEIELEDVGQLVGDEALQLVRRQVDGQDHAAADRLGEGQHSFGHEVGEEVRLLELGVRLVEDERDREVDLVLEVPRDLLIRALGVGHDAAQVLLELGVVVDLEVRALVDAPGEAVVRDLVLPEVGNELGAGGGRRREEEEDEGSHQETPHEPGAVVGHRFFLRLIGGGPACRGPSGAR